MDDCDLEKLSAAPAKLSPKFNRNVTEYEATVSSSVDKVKVDCLTSDSGASHQVFGGGGEKVIPLTEGSITEITIEVSAEDGTTKKYILRVKRLSASDASLNQLSLSCGSLLPPFSMDEDEYTTTVPVAQEEITVIPVPPDVKCEVTVAGNAPEQSVALQLGETKILTTVKSVDGTNSKDYCVTVVRKQFPWPVQLKDTKLAMKYECPMTLSPIYNPISIAGSDPKVIMSQPCLDMLTRRSKVNPFDETVLGADWKISEGELNKLISNCVAHSVYRYKGVTEELGLKQMPSHVQTCEKKPSTEADPSKVTDTPWYKAEFEATASKAPAIQHKVEVRNWEKRLQHMAGGSDPDQLTKQADKLLSEYRKKLPNSPGQPSRFADGESPSDDLQQAAACLAAALKSRSKDAKLHLRLGQVLEEQHYFNDMFQVNKKDSEQGKAGANVAAKEGSKLEECMAICLLRGVTAAAPIANQLQAIDAEYKSLLESGQSGRADHVQALYAWRSKDALKDEKAGMKRADEERDDPAARAYLKYMDAVACDPNNFACNLHAGRLEIERGAHADAVQRLQQAAGLKPANVEARFLLGLALTSRSEGAGDRAMEADTFLHDGVEQWLWRRYDDAMKPAARVLDGVKTRADVLPSASTCLHTDDFWRLSNFLVFRAFTLLAGNYRKSPPPEGRRSAADLYHTVALHASMALCSLVHRGDLYHQLEWMLLDSHYALLELKLTEGAKDWVAQRCRYLSAMIRSSTLPRDSKLLDLQQKVSQTLVALNPCDSVSLYLLGEVQLLAHDSKIIMSGGSQSLSDAICSFETSIELEGKPASGDVPDKIKDQQWWKDRVAAEKASAAPSKQPAAPPAAATRGRGAPPASTRARGRPAPARGAPPRGAPARGGRGAPPAKPAPGRGAKSSSSTPAAPSQAACDRNSKPAAAAPAPVATKPEAAPSEGSAVRINRTSHHARIGLARSLSRTEDRRDEARSRYEEVIKMAPDIHDAYIELAELLVKTDPLAAVDVYCRFPSTATEGGDDSFDDAYLSGEIVSILMKHEKFDDQRLVEHMVKWGRVMGIGVLEKYMGILDAKFKTDMLKRIYSGVHRKDMDDPDLITFFKFKCWI